MECSLLTLSLRLLSFAEKGESVVEVGVAENEKQFFFKLFLMGYLFVLLITDCDLLKEVAHCH